MAYRTLEITLVSGKGLKEVNLLTKMAVYAVVSVSCDSRVRQRTPPDHEGGRNPSWNVTVRLSVPADFELAGGHTLHILLRTERILGDRDVGEVRVPLSELLAGADVEAGPRPVQFVSYQVRRTGSGKPKGVLNFSYKLGERVEAPPALPAAYYTESAAYHAPPAIYPPQGAAYPSAPSSAPAFGPYSYGTPPASKADVPVMAYPVGPSSAAYPAYGAAASYLPPQGYQQSPPYGYRYPPGGYDYGYGAAPLAVMQPPRKNNFGMGLGAGLLGGALGGMLIGDLISDGVAYDSGYDAGFDDAGGYDF